MPLCLEKPRAATPANCVKNCRRDLFDMQSILDVKSKVLTIIMLDSLRKPTALSRSQESNMSLEKTV